MRLLTTLVALSLVTAFGTASAELLKRDFDSTVALRSGGSVELKNITGHTTVTGWDREEVRVRAVVELESDDIGKEALEFFEGIDIDMDHDWNSVKIKTRFPDKEWDGNKPGFEDPDIDLDFDLEDGEHSEFVEGILALVGKIVGGVSGWVTGIVQQHMPVRVNYEVSVPRKCDLKIENVTGELLVTDVHGDIETSVITGNSALVDAAGRLECSSITGDIEIEGAAGEIRVKIITGAATVSLADDAEFNGMDCNVINGDILVRIPSELKAFDLDVKSINGEITLDTDKMSGVMKRGGGQKGSVNGGGPKLDLKAINGSIRVEKAVR